MPWGQYQVSSATLALAGRPVAQERTRLVFATAGQGSAFLAFGKAVAPVVERYVPVAVEVRETKGSNENAELVGAGQVQIATLNMGPAHDAWNGQGPFARRQLRTVRSLLSERRAQAAQAATDGSREAPQAPGTPQKRANGGGQGCRACELGHWTLP